MYDISLVYYYTTDNSLVNINCSIIFKNNVSGKNSYYLKPLDAIQVSISKVHLIECVQKRDLVCDYYSIEIQDYQTAIQKCA